MTHPPTRVSSILSCIAAIIHYTEQKASAEYDYVDFEHTGSIPAPPSQGPKSPPPRPPLPDAIYRNMQTSPNVSSYIQLVYTCGVLDLWHMRYYNCSVDSAVSILAFQLHVHKKIWYCFYFY